MPRRKMRRWGWTALLASLLLSGCLPDEVQGPALPGGGPTTGAGTSGKVQTEVPLLRPRSR